MLLWPGPLGAHNFQPMSFSPRSGLVYIPYMQLAGRYSKAPPTPGSPIRMGVSIEHVAVDAEDNTGAVLAWDPVEQRERWRVPLETLWNGGMLSTAGGLVFHGAADGMLSAYDDTSGERLWQFYVGQGILASPMSFAVDGVQYVSVLAGYGGSAAAISEHLAVGWKYHRHERRLLTFRLGGDAELDALPREMTVQAVDDPSIEIDEAGRPRRSASLRPMRRLPRHRAALRRLPGTRPARVAARAERGEPVGDRA